MGNLNQTLANEGSRRRWVGAPGYSLLDSYTALHAERERERDGRRQTDKHIPDHKTRHNEARADRHTTTRHKTTITRPSEDSRATVASQPYPDSSRRRQPYAVSSRHIRMSTRTHTHVARDPVTSRPRYRLDAINHNVSIICRQMDAPPYTHYQLSLAHKRSLLPASLIQSTDQYIN